MQKCEQKIVVLLTPPGRGAIATVRAEGVDCTTVADRFFVARSGKTLAETSTERTLVGHFHSPNSPTAEEVVARRCSERAIEIHGHGGVASVARIVEAFEEAGYKKVAWEEWAALHMESPNRAEAYRALAHAQTERTAAILLDQFHGALDEALQRIKQCDDPAEKNVRIETLLKRAVWGVHLTQPWRIVIAGSPNVGKSSLMNRLLGYDRAITDPTPGTTRDLVQAETVFAGWPVELIDTAGLRDGEHPVERIGVKRALSQLESAELILVLLDATRAPTPEEIERIESLQNHSAAVVLTVRSKSDLVDDRSVWGDFAETSYATEAIDTSAASGEGVELLISTIEARLFPPMPEPRTAVPWTESQIAEIEAM